MHPDKRPTVMLWALVACAAFFAGISFFITKKDSQAQRPAANVPIFGEVDGNYVFIGQDGQTFQTTSMRGDLWLVNFFFTTCHGPCPLMTQKIAAIMLKFPQLKALSLSTDPETDTTEVLKAYAEKFKADAARWIMARGDAKTLQQFGQETLKLPVGETPDAHSARVVLIDRRGQIRGWYDSEEAGFPEKISTDIVAVQ